MTDPGRHAAAVAALPDDLDALVAVVQGVLVHELLVAVYGIELDATAREAIHDRRVEAVLDRVVALDPAPLDVPRPPERRVAGNCRQISVLLTALLRAHGRPARARCGFGTYFVEGTHEDHWACETVVDGRWVLVDAQMDDVQRDLFGIDFPATDVPRDAFVVAGDAWTRYRAGELDGDTCGLTALPEFGAWWITQNLVRDAASLAGTKMLPWDVWGAMAVPGVAFTDEQVAFFDRLAELTADPDAHADELAHLAATDDRLRVPEQVFNAGRGCVEPV